MTGRPCSSKRNPVGWGTGGATTGTTGGVCSKGDTPDAGCLPRVDPTSTSTNAAPPNALRTYAYDPIGRPYSDGSRSYSWNLADQITQISGVAAYGYDANGKRIKTTLQNGTVEYDLYDLQGQLVYSFKPALNKQTDFLNLAGKPLAELVNGIPTYLHPDLLGSPRLATSATKAIVWREHFDPYGQKLNSVNDRTGYTGHAYDQESGLTYAQARFYDPMVGRFLSTDPITFQDGDPGTFNRYAYVSDSPYDHTDPTGMAQAEQDQQQQEPSKDKERTTGSNIPGSGHVDGTGHTVSTPSASDSAAGGASSSNNGSGNGTTGGDSNGSPQVHMWDLQARDRR